MRSGVDGAVLVLGVDRVTHAVVDKSGRVWHEVSSDTAVDSGVKLSDPSRLFMLRAGDDKERLERMGKVKLTRF